MANRNEIVEYLNKRLDIASFDDPSANGLQVQGKDEVSKIGLAVDAAIAVYKQAASMGCDMLAVHHGIVWGGGIRSVTGRDYQHVRFLIENNMSLYAAHLPLDAHPEIGNNAELARIAGLKNIAPFGSSHGVAVGFSGFLPAPCDLNTLVNRWKDKIGGMPHCLPFGQKTLKTVAIVSGGGSGALKEAIDKGIDCFATGEGKHEDHHAALEGKMNLVYLGHYHSETAGIKALGRELSARFNIECAFIDEPTLLC